MILGPKETAWTVKVTEAAHHHGWTVYGQQTHNQRQHEPSIVLIQGRRVVLAYLRATSTRDSAPYVHRFDRAPGVEVYVWCPADWPQIRTMLALGRVEQPDAAAPTEAGSS